MKNFIKLNDYYSHLSLGNVILCIKGASKNSTSTIQSEVFCAIFGINDANSSTVNNYCIGARRIGDEYRQIYIQLRKKFKNNINVMENIVKNILTLIYGSIMDGDIFHNKELDKLCRQLFNISKNDFYVDNDAILVFKSLMNENRYYECFCEMLMYAILDKKQPLFENEQTKNIIETLLDHTEISALDLQNFLLLELNEGANFTHSIMNLANDGNPYANYRLGSMEYSGEYFGVPRFDKAYEYFVNSASKNHPSALWMIGNMIMRGQIGSKSDEDLTLAFEYFEKGYKLGSVASINSLGLCYKFGYAVKKDLAVAITYFEEAASKNYAYAYNNLGLIYENSDVNRALECFLKSSELNESFACNKVGEILRKKGLKKEALEYYQKALNNGVKGRSNWAEYNIAKHYYLKGDLKCNIPKNIDLATRYFLNCDFLIESLIELFFIFFEKKDMDKVAEIKEKIELHSKYSLDIKRIIEKKIDAFKKINY